LRDALLPGKDVPFSGAGMELLHVVAQSLMDGSGVGV
jgi:hypothetical protein